MNETISPPSSPSRRRSWWQALDNRLRLAGLELTEARGRLAGVGVGMVATLLSVQLLLAALLVVVVAVSWETSWRVTAPALAGAVFGLVALVVGLLTWRAWRDWEPWAETRRQLVQDLAMARSEFAAAGETTGGKEPRTETNAAQSAADANAAASDAAKERSGSGI